MNEFNDQFLDCNQTDELYKNDTDYDAGVEDLFNRILFRPDVEIDESGDIMIYNLNWQKLSERIQGLYKEKNVFRIFDVVYNKRDIELYNGRRIPRQKMRIVGIKTEQFFALEAKMIFESLYEKYGLNYYRSIADQLYENTWLSKTYLARTKINLSHLKELRYTLKDYQLQFVKDYPKKKDEFNLDGVLLGFDQGMGKTLTAIAVTLALECDFVVIISPNTIKGNWVGELKEYFYKYQDDDQLFKDEVYAIRESKHKFNKDKIKYLIVNHESIDATIPYLPTNRKKTAIILDESHFFRNMDSARSQQLVQLKDRIKSKNNLMMSGTPIKATPAEIVPVMMMIDPMFTNKAASKYSKMFDVKGLEAADIVKNRFSRVMYRKTKEQVLKMPPKEFHELSLKIKMGEQYTLENISKEVQKEFDLILNAEQSNFLTYKKMFRKLLEHYQTKYHKATNEQYQAYLKYIDILDKGQDPKMKLHELDLIEQENFTKRYIIPYIQEPAMRKEFEFYETRYLRLRASVLGRAMGKVVPDARTHVYIDIFKEHAKLFIDMINKCPKKTIIFTPLLGVAKGISAILEENDIPNILIVGETTDRTELIARFKNEDVYDVLVASVQTLSTGYTLTMASQMFFFGLPWRKADYDQAVARIHRLGQTETCHIYNVFLDTSSKGNITTRIKDIMTWSGNMNSGFISDEAPLLKNEVID